MREFMRLAEKIEECKRHLFAQGYAFSDADDYVKLVFEETGLRFGLFTDVDVEQIRQAIVYLNEKILTLK